MLYDFIYVRYLRGVTVVETGSSVFVETEKLDSSAQNIFMDICRYKHQYQVKL